LGADSAVFEALGGGTITVLLAVGRRVGSTKGVVTDFETVGGVDGRSAAFLELSLVVSG